MKIGKTLIYFFTTIFFNNLFSQTLSISISTFNCIGTSFTASATGNSFAINSCTWSVNSNSISISGINSTLTNLNSNSAGAYTLTLIASSGTTTLQTQKTFSVFPNTTVSVVANKSVTCINQNYPKQSKPVLLTASGAISYAWMPYDPSFPQNGPQTNVTPSSTVCYTVYGSSANFCTGIAVICISVSPQFTLLVTPFNPTICQGDQIKLQILNVGLGAIGLQSSFTYSWTDPEKISISPAAGLTSSVFTFPQINCTYTVDAKDSIGCVSIPETISVTVQKCLGNEKVKLESSVMIFPSPIHDLLNIETLKNSEINISLINTYGDIVIQKNNVTTSQSLDVSYLTTGMYFVRIENENETKVFKILKE